MGNVAMHAATGRSRLAHTLVQARLLDGRGYWECSCYAGRFLPRRENDTEHSATQRARISHAKHAAKALDEQRRLGLS